LKSWRAKGREVFGLERSLNISFKGGFGRNRPAGWSGSRRSGGGSVAGVTERSGGGAKGRRGGAHRGRTIPPERTAGVQSRRGTIPPPAQRGEAGPPPGPGGGAAERVLVGTVGALSVAGSARGCCSSGRRIGSLNISPKGGLGRNSQAGWSGSRRSGSGSVEGGTERSGGGFRCDRAVGGEEMVEGR
jgi:hypothetical protein